MKYLFTTLLIINSIIYLYKGGFYLLFVLASIVALSCVIKVNNRQTLFLVIASTLSGACGIVLALALQNIRIFVLCLILFVYFLALAIASTNQPTYKDNSPAKSPAIKKPTFTYHKYPIDSKKKRVKHYFDIVDEYYTAADYGYEEGVFPYYTYRHLPCHLETRGDYYSVIVETKKDAWEYIGKIFKSSVLEDDLCECEKYYVDVTGGTQHVLAKGKNEKEWLPLEFTLVICLRNDN